MAKAAGHILKGDDVKIEGQFHLDVGLGQSPTGGQKVPSPALSAPKARVVESHPEYAVVEVTCSCGTKTNLRCEYAAPMAPGEIKTPNSHATVSGGIPDKQM